MKTLLVSIAAIVAFASLAPITFAAYNDVTLTTGAVISVGGYTLSVSGSSAVIQSIVVNSSSFSVILASGSSFKVSSPTLNQLSSDITTDVTSNTCTGSESSITLAYSGGGTVTNIITPSATVYTTSSGGGSGGGGGSSSGGGEGPPPPPPPSVYSTPDGTGTTTNPYWQNGGTGSASSTTALSHRSLFFRNLKYGDEGADVLGLQKYLNSQLFMVARSGPGSPGNETTYFGKVTQLAVMKFQRYNHITPISGFLGPKTRALINASP